MLRLFNAEVWCFRKGSVGDWEEGAALRIQRVKRHYEGAYGSGQCSVGYREGRASSQVRADLRDTRWTTPCLRTEGPV